MNKIADQQWRDDWVKWAQQLPSLKQVYIDLWGTPNRMQEPHVKRDNMWKTRVSADNRVWHDYYTTRWSRTHTVTEQFRYEGGKGKRAGSAGFQPYRVERNDDGQYKFYAIGKPLKTLQQAKDFVEVFVRLEKV